MHSKLLTRGIGLTLSAAMLAFGLGNSVQARTTAHPAQLTNVTLQLKWVPQAQFGGYYVALDKGFYRQEGLNVNIKAGGPDIAPEAVVQAGGADFGIDWLSALLRARDTGLQLQNVAQIYQATGMRLLAFKSSGVASIGQFRNHKIGVWPSGNEYQFQALMDKWHMSPPNKYMTVAQEGFTMDDFLSHQIDVAHAMTYNEVGVVLEHGIKKSALNIFDYNKLGVSILEDGIFAKPSWLQGHKDTAVRFLRASIKGWQYAVAHPDQAGRMSFRHTAGGTTTLAHQVFMAREVAKLINYGPGKTHTIGYMDPPTYHRTWGTLFRHGVIHRAPKNAFTQVYWKAAGGH
jgi:NitT/TauT family transport system substrate-binding protein